MPVLQINNISKSFKTSDKKEIHVLKNITIQFPQNGMVFLYGKSGSGKSTLLNIIGLIEKPDEGDIRLGNKLLTKQKENKVNAYRNKQIGYIFQHYNLLEDEDVIYNISLPLLIGGMKLKDANKEAIKLLEMINFPPKLYKKKCKELSGGEKERVAVLRAFSNYPKIILADEPTGALDSDNSKRVMDILKTASRKRLVIVVSHNEELVKTYADRIIHLDSGRISKVEVIKPPRDYIHEEIDNTFKRGSEWTTKLINSNFKKRYKRNIISVLSLITGIVFSLLIMGFAQGAPKAVFNESLRQMDYDSITLTKEISSSKSSNGLSIVQMLKPTKDEINSISSYLTNFYIEPNFDAIIPQSLSIKSDEIDLEGILYSPIYKFKDNYFEQYLYKGYMPSKESLSEVVVNKKAYNNIKNNTGIEPLNSYLTLTCSYTSTYVTEDGRRYVDTFDFNKKARIVGVVDEQVFLNNPKIFYSYIALETLMKDSLMTELSSYYEYDFSWYDRVDFASSNDDISSYSLRVFARDKASIDAYASNEIFLPKPYVMSSTGKDISDALDTIVSSASAGMSVFLIVAIVGSVLILGIISFSGYTEDRKTSAILSCLGASKDNIVDIYSTENIYLGLISFVCSLILFFLFRLLINFIVKKTLGYLMVITLPIVFDIPYFAFTILLLLVVTLFVSILSAFVPIMFSKNISIAKELRDE